MTKVAFIGSLCVVMVVIVLGSHDAAAECVGGTNDGAVCSADSECPGGFCSTLATPTPPPAPTPTVTPSPLRHYECYEAPRDPFASFSIPVTDEFGAANVTVIRRKRICSPSDKNDEDPTAPLDPTHLTGYIIKQVLPAFVPVVGVTVQNQFGTVVVDLKKPDYLMVPAAKSLTAPPGQLVNPSIDHFKCYKVRGAKTQIPGIKLKDQFTTLTFDIKKPMRLCIPVDKNNSGIKDPTVSLMCYKGRQSSFPKFRGLNPVYIDDQFGAATTEVDHLRELCVPSVACAVASVDVAPIMNGAPVDNNPNAGAGLRVFSEQATAAGPLLNQVNIVATTTAAAAGKKVYFKAFDVDDPSSNANPIDPNGALGVDNRGVPQSGTLSALSANTDAMGKATVTLATTRQPGDNFKVAASCDRLYLDRVDLKPTDGSVIQDAKNNALPTARGKLTPMLSVWRKVHVEVDAMQASAGNRYQGMVTAVNNLLGFGFVTTNLAAMEAARLEGGRLDVAGVGAFPILSNTGSMIVTSAVVPAAALNKNFDAYDDDDFNNNDGAAKKGDTGEALVAPDQSLVQNSDAPASNLFAPAYVRPVYDLANATPNPPFVVNQVGDNAPNVRALYSYDNLASNVRDFWVVYMLGAYQPITAEDQDPGTDTITTGRVDDLRGQGAVTYLEMVSNREFATISAQVDKDATCAGNAANYKATFRNAETTAHEVGHLFGAAHSDGGIMSDQCAVATLTFSNTTVAEIRTTLRP